MPHTRRSAIASTFAGLGVAAQTRVGNAPISPKGSRRLAWANDSSAARPPRG